MFSVLFEWNNGQLLSEILGGAENTYSSFCKIKCNYLNCQWKFDGSRAKGKKTEKKNQRTAAFVDKQKTKNAYTYSRLMVNMNSNIENN